MQWRGAQRGQWGWGWQRGQRGTEPREGEVSPQQTMRAHVQRQWCACLHVSACAHVLGTLREV